MDAASKNHGFSHNGNDNDGGGDGRSNDNNDHDATPSSPPPNLTPEIIREILSPFTADQLRSIVEHSLRNNPSSVLSSVRSIADHDISRRTIRFSDLPQNSSHISVNKAFRRYGSIRRISIARDIDAGRYKDSGSITFKHVDSALSALSEPVHVAGHQITCKLANQGKESKELPGSCSSAHQYVGLVEPEQQQHQSPRNNGNGDDNDNGKRRRPEDGLMCPHCESNDTKFRQFTKSANPKPYYKCKGCHKHWTDGGTLRNTPAKGKRRKAGTKTTSS